MTEEAYIIRRLFCPKEPVGSSSLFSGPAYRVGRAYPEAAASNVYRSPVIQNWYNQFGNCKTAKLSSRHDMAEIGKRA
jgi:hypothetical protein